MKPNSNHVNNWDTSKILNLRTKNSSRRTFVGTFWHNSSGRGFEGSQTFLIKTISLHLDLSSLTSVSLHLFSPLFFSYLSSSLVFTSLLSLSLCLRVTLYVCYYGVLCAGVWWLWCGFVGGHGRGFRAPPTHAVRDREDVEGKNKKKRSKTKTLNKTTKFKQKTGQHLNYNSAEQPHDLTHWMFESKPRTTRSWFPLIIYATW